MRRTAPVPALLVLAITLAAVPAGAGYPKWRCWGPGLPDPCRNQLEAVSIVPGTQGAEAWAVGRNGTFLHGDGQDWENVFVDTDLDLLDVAMASTSLGWAVGAGGKIFTWNGIRWSRYQGIVGDDDYVRAVAIVPDSDPLIAWAAYDWGGVGGFLRYNGSEWKKETGLFGGSVFDIVMLSEDNGWAVGRHIGDGTIHHWDGSSWEQVHSVDQPLQGISFLTPDDGWAVGDEGAMYHFNGAEWTAVEPATDEWLQSVSMVATDDAWAVGESGTILNWDGSIWNDVSDVFERQGNNDVVVEGPAVGWIVGEGGSIRRFDADRWVMFPGTSSDSLDHIASTPDSDTLWAVGGGPFTLRFDGSRWAEVPGSASNHYSIAMASPDDGWAFGWANAKRYFHHWNGLRWEAVHEGESAADMVILGPDDGWAVGWGTIQRLDGSSWTEVASPTSRTLRGVSAVSADDVWAAGYSGTILHWDGSEWLLVDSPVEHTFEDISMAGPDKGYIVGLRSGLGTALKWNGVNWQTLFLDDNANDLFGVHVTDTPSGAVGWMVGAYGYTARLSGSQWYPEPSPTKNRLTDVLTVSAEEAWAVGDGGVILHWSDSPVPEPPTGLLITAAAKLSGQAGTDWKTDLVATNLGKATTTVAAEAWHRDQANPNPTRETFTLAPMASRTMNDVLSDLFSLPNSSAVSIVLDADQRLAIGSRTYNSTPGGTYGQSIPSTDLKDTFAAGEVAVLTGLVEGPSARSNLGIVNTSTGTIRVHADFYEAGGGPLGSTEYDVPARGSIQRTRVLRDVHTGPVDLAWVTLRSIDGEFAAYLSTVDANTGDPVYRPAGSLELVREESILQGMAKVAGAAGTNWRSSLSLINTVADYSRPMTFEKLVRGQPNPTPQTTSIILGPGEAMVIDDVLQELFGMSNGAISLKVHGWGDVLMNARTFNQTSSGTYGQFIPAQGSSNAIGSAARGVFIGVVQNQNFRSNLGLTNPTSRPGIVSLTLVDATGDTVGSPQEITLAAGEVTQIDRVSEIFGAPRIEGATLVVEHRSGASIQAFLSVIDSRTGDPVFQTPTVD